MLTILLFSKLLPHPHDPRIRKPRDSCQHYLPFPAVNPGAEAASSLHSPLNSTISPTPYLSIGLVCLTAFEMVAE